MSECSFEPCIKLSHAKGLCIGHCQQRSRGEELRPLLVRKSNNVDEISPFAIHYRTRALWGRAALHPCVECGTPARDWAYDGTDPTEGMVLEGKYRGWRYSVWPEFYMPMCAKCHSAKDKQAAADELFEYRLWKHTNPGKALMTT